MKDKIKEKLEKEIEEELEKGITRNKVLPLNWAMDRIKPILEKAIEETKKEERENIMQEIYLLDWIKIMINAIEGRKTSWDKNPIIEWRNASDEVLMAFMSEAREKSIFPDVLEELKKELKNE